MAETPPKRYKLYLETTKKRRSKRTTSFPRAVDEYRQKHNTSGPLNIFDVTNSMKSSIVDGKHSISTNVAGVENVSGVEPENRSDSSSNCEEMNLHRQNQDTSTDTQTITTEIKNNTFQPKEHTDFLKQSSDGYDRIMFKESETSINDVITMITGFTLRFGLCNNGRTQLMEMFKLCAGSQYNDVSISDHQYNKIFEIPEETIIAHYYCAKCTKIIYISPKISMKDTEVICDQCVEIIRLNSLNENYFLSINVEYQLKELLKSKNIYSAISESFNNEYSNNSKITDITDSELFVKFANNNEKTIYLNVSTNGTPIFRESKRSMWPLQILVNNLPPRLRFNNVIIAGFMIVTHEPTPELMNLFMESFVKQIESLNSKGFNLADNNTESNQEKINVAVSNFSADSVTQALCQNRVKHSEYFACSYCYIMGETSDGAKHFPFTATIEELRTHDSHIKDVAKCNKKKPKVECRGVEGPSELLSLPNFDMIWSFPFDSMNTWDLGVTKFLWELILKGLNKEETLRLDELVNTIKPSCTVGILPKAFTDFNNFEAKDFNALLLFYSIPIGFDIFSDDIMYLLALLSKSLFTLSQHEISEDELNECEEMLIIFVDSFQKIFGESKMKLNVHLLLHAVDSVRKSGPLWANYTYLHEGSIHFLKMLVNDAEGVDLQIIEKSINAIKFKSVFHDNNRITNEKVSIYCKNLFSDCKEPLIGTIHNGVLYNESDSVKLNHTSDKKYYDKCVYNKNIYSTMFYDKTNKWDDSYIQLKSGKFARILEIFSSENENLITIEIIDVQQLNINGIVMTHVWKVEAKEIKVVITSLENVLRKVIYIKGENFDFITVQPGNYHND